MHILEAVQRGGNNVIEAHEGIETGDFFQGYRGLFTAEFVNHFSLQPLQQMSLVHPGETGRQALCPLGQIEGNRYRHGALELLSARSLSQVFQQGVASQRIPHCEQVGAGKAALQGIYQIFDVAGVTGMVAACQAIVFPTATPEMHEYHPPAIFI